MKKVDILYLTFNRSEFTERTFELLLANTDWDLVNCLYLYDDDSTDRTIEYLAGAVNRVPVRYELVQRTLRSPVAVMNDYVKRADEDVPAFAKIDNDIACPPGWLTALVDTMERSPLLEILGMQAGRERELVEQGIATADLIEQSRRRGWIGAPHIGGVGLMRLRAFRSRPAPGADGRFGFTAWQQQFDGGNRPLVRGWVLPDIQCPQLDFLPFEPWASLSQRYRDSGWQRYSDHDGVRGPVWPPYDVSDHAMWDWMNEPHALDCDMGQDCSCGVGPHLPEEATL